MQPSPAADILRAMLNIVSIVVGVVAAFLAVFAFLPLLGWAYWLIIPVALVGLVIGALSSSGKAGRNLNLIVIAIGVIRLSIGGGIF